jgi:serine/threonine-protein kinase
MTTPLTLRNPYISRGPVRSPEMFYGRNAELWEIASFIGGNQSIAVVGQRKIGKTSLLFHLMRPETRESLGLGPENVLTYLDCEMLGQSSTDEIFGQFANEIAAAMGEMGLDSEPALETAIAKPTRLAFEAAVRKLNQRRLRIVIILDEFERMSTNTALDLNFFNALRSAAGRYQLVFITASARPLIELTYSGRSQEILSSPFFNIFAPLFLNLLSPEDAQRLICEPAIQVGKPFSVELQEFLYQLAGGHPLAIQVACFHAFNTPNDPDAIAASTERELSAHFQYYWHNLTPLEQDTLRRIGEASSRAHNDTTLRATLRDLVQKGLLVAVNDAYYYPSQAWANFVGTQYGSSGNTSRLSGGLLTGSHIGAYEVHDLLGRGGMAEVYRGRHSRLDRTVAIKVLSSALANEGDFRRRFEREAQSIAALKHPNIVGVFDFGDVDGMYYMVMEFVAGQSLDRFLAQTGALPIDQSLPIVTEIAYALDYAHGEGVVHRDVKPSNVMLEPVHPTESNSLGLRAILTDFGIAKLINKEGTKTDGLTGTLDYMAPEQIRVSQDIDGRADIYALGVVMFQMITGQLPYVGENPAAILMGHLQEPIPDVRRYAPDTPAPVAAAIVRAMAKEPDDRFGSTREFVDALKMA